jgi:hypothetical protein
VTPAAGGSDSDRDPLAIGLGGAGLLAGLGALAISLRRRH